MARLRHTIATLLHKRWLWQAAFAVSIIAIFYLATTDSNHPMPSSDNDKINHLIAFIELTVLARLSWPHFRGIWYLPALLGVGFALETIQASLPYRSFSFTDVIADAAGIVIGLLVWHPLQCMMSQSVENPPDHV